MIYPWFHQLFKSDPEGTFSFTILNITGIIAESNSDITKIDGKYFMKIIPNEFTAYSMLIICHLAAPSILAIIADNKLITISEIILAFLSGFSVKFVSSVSSLTGFSVIYLYITSLIKTPANITINNINIIIKDSNCEFNRINNPENPAIKYAYPFIELLIFNVKAIKRIDVRTIAANM